MTSLWILKAIKTLGKNRPACVVACLHADGGYIDFFIWFLSALVTLVKWTASQRETENVAVWPVFWKQTQVISAACVQLFHIYMISPLRCGRPPWTVFMCSFCDRSSPVSPQSVVSPCQVRVSMSVSCFLLYFDSPCPVCGVFCFASFVSLCLISPSCVSLILVAPCAFLCSLLCLLHIPSYPHS